MRQRRTELSEAAAACRMAFGTLVLFSFCMNLLQLAAPIYMLQVYDRVMVTGRLETLVLLTLMIAAALLVFGLLDALRGTMLVRLGGWLNQRLAPIYLEASVRARLRGDAAGTQPLRDLAQVQSFIPSAGLSVFFDLPWSPLFILLIWMLHPMLGLLAAGSAVLLVVLGIANDLVTRGPTAAGNTAQIASLQQADAAIRNAEVVQAMGMLPALSERWTRENARSIEAARQASERGALLLGLTKCLRIFVQSATLGLGAYLVLQGEATGGAMIASSILLARALAPIEIAMGSARQLGLTRLAWARLQLRSRAVPPLPVRTRLPAPAGFVAFDRVTYTPPGARAPVLQGVSFRAEPGEAVAVIGPSASGKSTLCRLLVGTAEPSAGEVRLDGSEIRHWNTAELGCHIGYLPQDVELFAGTVRDNIARMGERDDEAVVAAAKLAFAHEMIQRLPQGYDTPIGDGGARLSGGQRQRLGLARAVYGGPQLIVLDEPNANLDQHGEAALAAAIGELKQRGATVLIIGHRPSTMSQADRILLLKDGRVELFAPREEALKRMRLAAATARDAVTGAVPQEASPPALPRQA
ncbi:MAG: type I secretion system permease/ATPase [Acetobacteraceae bacterium]|nr:MAG: type I secretion system permease/ATPase [Acetobacteraceae bacterium]